MNAPDTLKDTCPHHHQCADVESCEGRTLHLSMARLLHTHLVLALELSQKLGESSLETTGIAISLNRARQRVAALELE